jgi:hypothetical protein
LEAEHKQCGQLAKRKRELQLKEEKFRKEKKRLLEKESVTKEVAKELRKELLERDREGWRVPTPGNSNSYSEAIDGTTIVSCCFPMISCHMCVCNSNRHTLVTNLYICDT